MDKAIQSAFTAIPEISLKALTDHLQSTIIEMYDGRDFAEYRGEWTSKMKDYAKERGFDFTKTKANWEDIYVMVIGKLVANSYSWQETSVSPIRRASSTSCRSSAMSQSNTPTDSTAVPIKIARLSDTDKSNIQKMYNGLDRAKMWKLSTGTVVEDKMKGFALSLDCEHPSHSLILDITDSCWTNVFTKEERDEIRQYKCVDLPAMTTEVQASLSQFENTTSGPELQSIVDSTTCGLETDAYWVQKSYCDAYRLLKAGYFPLQGETEGSLLKRVWSCIDSYFDFSTIKCVGGEKCSRASADASNKDRCLSDLGRQSSGRKMDFLFTTRGSQLEVGAGECGLSVGVKTTKELMDASFKLPKVMKDMANSLITKYSGLSHNLCITSLYIGGNAIQLHSLDFPAGYVARYDGFGPVLFPQEEGEIYSGLSGVLKLIFSARQLMENERQKITTCKTSEITRIGIVPEYVIPTFVPALITVNQKKRRFDADVE